MLGLEAELAVGEAKMEVYNANQENRSVAHSSGRITYDKSLAKTLNPAAQEFIPKDDDQQTAQINQQLSASMEDRPKRRNLSIQPQHTVDLHDFRVSQNEQSLPKESQTQPSDSLLSREVFSIMSKQTEITAALVTQQLSMTLPPIDIPIFDGDPLLYRTFIKAFE